MASAVGVTVPSTLASSRKSLDIGAGEAISDRFEHGGEALADADAHRRDAIAAAATAQLPDERRGEAGAGAAERVAEGDRAAVDVELLFVDSQLSRAGQHLGGEGLVQLDQVDVVE